MTSKDKQLSAEKLLRIVLDTIPLRVFWKDVDLRYLGANQKLIDDIGFKDLESLIGETDYAIFDSPEDAEPKRDDDREVIESGKAKLDIEEPLVVPGKQTKWLRTNKAPMVSPDGEIIGVLGTYQDITAEVEYRQRIEQMALIDSLTGLANRRSLQHQISTSHYARGGLLFIDLDRFKHVNDTLGHATGDQLLQLVAHIFQVIADRHEALLARLGGDEFSIFKSFRDSFNIEEELEQIAQEVLNALNRPLQLNHHVISIGASIGITTLSGSPRSTKECFTEADLAMYSAKRNALCKYQFFTKGLMDSAKRQHTLYAHLYRAVEKQELYLVFQPQFQAGQGLIGAEALLRWRNDELGDVSPLEFIPVAEESGIIHEIGNWVIREALDCLKGWETILRERPDFKLAINVSSIQFENKNLPTGIKEALYSRGLSGRNLEIEITESLLLKHKDLAAESMISLKEVGVSIAIDDFGTGYSSLVYLMSLPLNKLKIDRAFVTDLDKHSTNRKLVETIIKLASSLELNVLAEGVETEQERAVLEELNCLQYQGFLYSKPLLLDQFNERFGGLKADL